MTKHAAHAGAPLPDSISTRIGLVFFGMLQICLAAGLVVGWAGIAGSMLGTEQGVGAAGLTLDETTQLYGIAAAVNYISPLGLGVMLDKYGPRVCSTFANTIVAIGCLIFALSTQLSTFAVGISFIAFGGPGVQTSLMHLGNLFPSRRFFVMGCVAESITLSFAIFPLMDVIWEKTQLSFRVIFGCLSILVAISAVGSSWIWPDAAYEVVVLKQEPEEEEPDNKLEYEPDVASEKEASLSVIADEKLECKDLKEYSLREHVTSGIFAVSAVCASWIWPDAAKEEEAEEEERDNELEYEPDFTSEKEAMLSIIEQNADEKELECMDLKECSLREQLSSGVYIRLSIFFLVSSWWANFYIATVTTELGDQQRFDLTKQHELARLLSFIDAGAIIFAPLSGYLLDSAGFAVTAVITVALGISQMVFLLIAGPHECFMIASFVSYAVFRAFMFPYYFASLSKKLGFRYFGILSGMSFFVSGLSQLAIAPLALVVEGTCHEFDDIHEMNCDEGKWATVHHVQILTLVALLLIPVIDVCAIKSQQQILTDRLLNSTKSSYGSVTDSTDSAELMDSPVY